MLSSYTSVPLIISSISAADILPFCSVASCSSKNRAGAERDHHRIGFQKSAGRVVYFGGRLSFGPATSFAEQAGFGFDIVFVGWIVCLGFGLFASG